MPGPGETNLVAILLPPAEAAVAVRRAWEDGDAVLVLDPNAPGPEIERMIAFLAPTHLLTGDGRQALDGIPVAAGTAAVVTTSGTTGAPKGVVLTRTGLEASARAVSDALGGGEGDGWLCCLPLHHVAGLGILARSFTTGASLVVRSPFDPAVVEVARRRREATLVSLVPTMVQRLLDAGAEIGGFRAVLVGGAPLPDALARRASAAGVHVVTTYGLTETWGGVVHDGRPLGDVDVDLGPGDEILVRGPMVMAGYRLRPDDTDAAFTADGRLRTGDVGVFDSVGRLQVIDRLSDLVITGGVNVSPAEVEAVLAAHPAVADVCVTGAPDPEWGERVVAHVVARDRSNPPSLDELRDFARPRLVPPKLPREVVCVTTIPRTSGGKALRRLLGARPPVGPAEPAGGGCLH